MARLDNHVGETGYDNLIIRAGDVGYVTLEAGQGILKRGSLVTEDNREVQSGGKTETVVKNSVLATGGAGDAAYVLTDDVDTGVDSDGDSVVGTVYKNGKFIRESLTVSEGDITDADIKALRAVGIIVESGVHFPA